MKESGIIENRSVVRRAPASMWRAVRQIFSCAASIKKMALRKHGQRRSAVIEMLPVLRNLHRNYEWPKSI